MAGQVFALQVLVVLLLVAAAAVALVVQSRTDADHEARNRSVAVAQTFANSPGIVDALRSPTRPRSCSPRRRPRGCRRASASSSC